MRLANLLTVIVLGLNLVSCAQMPSIGDPIAKISQNTVRSLTYHKHELSSAYQQLIHTEGNIAQIQEAFKNAQDDHFVRYSLAIVVYEKTLLDISDEERNQAHAFFQLALQDDFDWVKTKAVWGLSRVGSIQDFPGLIKIMNDPETFLEDDVHASLANIRARAGISDGRNPASENGDLDFHNTNYWQKWWSKNQKRFN